jgi:tetratricopeptide (TPR) repeat protein
MRAMKAVLALLIAAAALAACVPPVAPAFGWDDLCSEAVVEAEERVEACTRIIDAEGADANQKSQAHIARAEAYEELEQAEAATADYDAAIAVAPENDYAYIARANAHERAGRYEDAMRDTAEAIRLSPEEPTYLNNACWIRALTNRELDEAAIFCERALEADRENGNIWDSLALVRFKQGRYAEAYHHYDVAVRVDAEEAHYRYGRGLAALRVGKEENGRADLAAALALNEDIDDAYAGYGVAP